MTAAAQLTLLTASQRVTLSLKDAAGFTHSTGDVLRLAELDEDAFH